MPRPPTRTGGLRSCATPCALPMPCSMSWPKAPTALSWKSVPAAFWSTWCAVPHPPGRRQPASPAWSRLMTRSGRLPAPMPGCGVWIACRRPASPRSRAGAFRCPPTPSRASATGWMHRPQTDASPASRLLHTPPAVHRPAQCPWPPRRLPARPPPRRTRFRPVRRIPSPGTSRWHRLPCRWPHPWPALTIRA